MHDRGRVLADTAMMIADGGRVMSGLAVLRDQGELFGLLRDSAGGDRLKHLPSKNASINRAWLAPVAVACDLPAWIRLLCLNGDLAQAAPKTLRYPNLHTSARIISGQRRRTLRITEKWPWANELRDQLQSALILPMTI